MFASSSNVQFIMATNKIIYNIIIKIGTRFFTTF